MTSFFFPRKTRRILLSGAVAALVAGPALAAPQFCGPMNGPSRLTVTGEGQSRVAPDLATVQLGVTTQAESAADAMTRNSEQQRAVIEALTGAGIDEAQIQTAGLNLNPLMRYGDGQAPEVTGYQASNIVTVRVSQLERLGEVLDAIVAAGANEINGITFTREDGAEALDSARRDAVADARRKAEVLAQAAGLTLGSVLTLRDQATGNGGPRPMMRMEASMADAVPVQPGQMDMSAQVEIEYALTGDGACASMPMHRGGHGKGHGMGHNMDQGDHPPVPEDAPDVIPPLPDAGAPAPDEPIVPGIVEPLPETPAN
ncbi:SIMPL domain-containing protein [Paracoccus sp. (in: a-proteobacteria)]|uniref:SIMPL domain-containing protein n=1 Tax=Paracoccus sp. TaxID=267 RepID=UPI00396C754F